MPGKSECPQTRSPWRCQCKRRAWNDDATVGPDSTDSFNAASFCCACASSRDVSNRTSTWPTCTWSLQCASTALIVPDTSMPTSTFVTGSSVPVALTTSTRLPRPACARCRAAQKPVFQPGERVRLQSGHAQRAASRRKHPVEGRAGANNALGLGIRVAGGSPGPEGIPARVVVEVGAVL